MKNLDDVIGMKKLDTVNVLGSIELLGKQCEQAWNEVVALSFPSSYRQAKNIVFSGMGGSSLGAFVIKSLFGNEMTVPFDIVNDYHLPNYVDKSTLVLLGTYSGATEETLSCAQDALQKKAMITGFTVGSKLGDFFQANEISYFHINPTYNPSNQPRLGTGYTMFSQVAILNKLGYINVQKEDIIELITVLNRGNSKYGAYVKTEGNEAKQLAKELIDCIPVIVSAEFLVHVGRVMRNQINECAKSFAAYHDIPELNHHLMEGLTNPKINKDILRFFFYRSPSYSDRIKKRVEVTKSIVKKQGIKLFEFVPQAKSKTAQAFECIQFGAYTNYFMAILYGLDPSKIPWVDYFKEELAKL